ncbi:hypothetical protein CBS13152_10716 [Aspergillus niger]|nr:hypothetical protein CBS13152_10716 [Aspergillus niger]
MLFRAAYTLPLRKWLVVVNFASPEAAALPFPPASVSSLRSPIPQSLEPQTPSHPPSSTHYPPGFLFFIFADVAFCTNILLLLFDLVSFIPTTLLLLSVTNTSQLPDRNPLAPV